VAGIKQEAGKKCPKRSFLICTPSQILLVDMQLEKCTHDFDWGKLKPGRGCFEDPGIDTRLMQ
jgi:hypothetical protein